MTTLNNFKIDKLGRHLLFTTCLIQGVTSEGIFITGTGFFYEALIGEPTDGMSVPVLITNRHVAGAITTGSIRLIKADEAGNPLLGQSIDAAINQNDWVLPSDSNIDLAALLAGPIISNLHASGVEVVTRTIGWDLIPTEEVLEDLDVVEPITFVGYPSNSYDHINQTPIIRRGCTATPIQLNYNGKPTFLIDASIFPGSSGSPVFIIHENGYRKGGTTLIGASRILFIGVVAAVTLQSSPARKVVGDLSGLVFDQMIDLGLVFNYKAVNELVDMLCNKAGISRVRSTNPAID